MIYLISTKSSTRLLDMYDIYYIQEKNIYICFYQNWFKTNTMYDISKERYYSSETYYDRVSKPSNIQNTDMINRDILENLVLEKILVNI
jgi:hypothetical protein